MKQFSNLAILFFGSSEDSVRVVDKLFTEGYRVVAVVTQPPRPVGRKKIITPTPVESWATTHRIAVLGFPTQPDKPTQYQNEAEVINTLETFKPDLLVIASYGELIPKVTIQHSTYGGLNVHPSLLPCWRGADPVPWAILAGDRQTGASVATIEDDFDAGKVIGQKKISITEKDTHISLRVKLFSLGAELLLEILPEYLDGSNRGVPQDTANATWARRLTREDGFIPWDVITKAIQGEKIETKEFSEFFQQFLLPTTYNQQPTTLISNALRALSPWPGVWTEIPANRIPLTADRQSTKRLKILSGHVEQHEGKEKLVLEQVQLEGKTPIPFQQLVI